MPADLTTCSAVIVAHDVNLSIFKPAWLGRQGILLDEELAGQVVITPALVRVPTDRFELLVLPDRIQLRPAKESDRCQPDLVRILGGIVSKLPHTPFTAIGLNFDFLLRPAEDRQFAAWNAQQFAAPIALSIIGGEVDSASYGAFFTFAVLGMKLHADFRPVPMGRREVQDALAAAPDANVMQAKFNFHRDLATPASVAVIFEVLASWNAASSVASRLAAEALGQHHEG